MNVQPPPNNAPPAQFQLPPGVPIRKFKARAYLENNKTIDVAIDSLDHVGALCKLIGAIADVPMRVVKLEFVDVTGTKIILPPSRG